jgi:hypothetical protein
MSMILAEAEALTLSVLESIHQLLLSHHRGCDVAHDLFAVKHKAGRLGKGHVCRKACSSLRRGGQVFMGNGLWDLIRVYQGKSRKGQDRIRSPA